MTEICNVRRNDNTNVRHSLMRRLPLTSAQTCDFLVRQLVSPPSAARAALHTQAGIDRRHLGVRSRLG